MEKPPKKLLEQVRDIIRIKHYSYRTEETYIFWIRRYTLFHDKRHPKDMSSAEMESFLSHLAVKENVAASTQNQAPPSLHSPFPTTVNTTAGNDRRDVQNVGIGQN